MGDPLDIFVACAPGLEPLLRDELAAMVGDPNAAEATPGGVTMQSDAAGLHRICLECGLGSHVLVRIATFRAPGFSELERAAKKIDWSRWLLPAAPRTVRARARASRLYHTGAIAERFERAITAQLGPPPPDATASAEASGREATDSHAPDAPAVVARFERDRCTLSLDVTGDPLHRRGYRLAATKAPLREDLARALILASGWDPSTVLADPFSGAGTIPIEAALLARRIAPGRLRAFALEQTPLFDAELWRRLRNDLAARELPHAPAPIYASDRDAGAVQATRDNADRAGVLADLRVDLAALTAAPFLTDAPHGGALVTDPPHGRRLGDTRRLRALYQSLGRLARDLPSSRIALTSTDRRLTLATGLPLTTALLTDHGGTKLRFLIAEPRL